MDSKKFETELKQQPDTVNMDYVDISYTNQDKEMIKTCRTYFMNIVLI